MNDVFYYDPAGGRLRAKHDMFKGVKNSQLVRRAGEIASKLVPSGYRTVWIDNVCIREHIAIWTMFTGEWPKERLDHKDRDRSNNRIDNLRTASNGQNVANSRERVERGLPRGVYRTKFGQKYCVHFRMNKKLVRIARHFDTAEEAGRAARALHLRLHGEFSPYYDGKTEALGVDDLYRPIPRERLL